MARKGNPGRMGREIANIGTTTLVKSRKLGKLPAKRLKVGKALSISKGTIMKAFNIKSTNG